MAAKSQDKILFGAALFLMLASAGWMALQSSKLSTLRTSSEVNISSSAYVPAGVDAPTVSTKTWPPAPSQTSGPLWVYDVFTPPEIYYDSTTKQFTVTVPTVGPVTSPPVAPFGIELVQVRPDAFRLQLIGYVGSEGDYRGTFENTLSGETIIGRAGKVIPDLNLTIKSFEVKQKTVVTEESMPVRYTEASAVVVDNQTGNEVTLTNRKRYISGTPFAVLKIDGTSDTIQHKVGAKFTAGNATYTIVNVVAEPPSVEIRKESPDLKEPETKTLTPAAPVAPVPASPEPVAQPAPVASPFPFGN
jgi:hypothetical protein